MGIYRCPFTVLSYLADSKIVLIEGEPGKAPKRYNTVQVELYVEDPEEVAINFVSSHGKAFADQRDEEDGGTCYA